MASLTVCFTQKSLVVTDLAFSRKINELQVGITELDGCATVQEIVTEDISLRHLSVANRCIVKVLLILSIHVSVPPCNLLAASSDASTIRCKRQSLFHAAD